MPAWSAPAHRWVDRLGREAAACDQPGDDRVGVPHLAHAEFVSTPNGSGNVRSKIEHSLGDISIIRQSLRTFDCFVDVRDDSATPTAHLVAEDPEPSCPAASNRAFGNNATLLAVAVGDRRLLDHEAALRHAHLECGVVEVARRPPLEPRCHRLEDAPVQPHRMPACAKREPVEVDPRFRLCSHTGIQLQA
jgi:hypothetical protein